MGSDDYLQFLNLVETRNNERAEIYSKVEDAQKLVSSLSLRELQKKVGGTYHSVREGRVGILRLKPDLEATLPPPRTVEHKPARKCEHGMWKHRDDRKKSRHCSVCYPNIHADLVDWKDTEDDAAIKASYLSGADVKTLAKRFGLTQGKITEALNRSGLDMPEEFVPLDPETSISPDVP